MKSKITVYQLTMIALMAALLCVLSPMSIPIGVIPVSLATFMLYLTVYILGWKGAVLSTLIYLLLGAVGLPVFSGYAGGLAKLTGPTGGYLVGYLVVSLIGGLTSEKTHGNVLWTPLSLILATAILYALGTLWYCFQTSNTFVQGLTVCVEPFILLDLGKIIVATVLGKALRAALNKAGLIPVEKESEK